MQQTCANKCCEHVCVWPVVCVCVSVGAGRFGTFMSASCWQIQPPSKKPVTSLPSAHTHTHTHRHKATLLFYKNTYTNIHSSGKTYPYTSVIPPTTPKEHQPAFQILLLQLPIALSCYTCRVPARQPLPPVINFHMRERLSHFFLFLSELQRRGN